MRLVQKRNMASQGVLFELLLLGVVELMMQYYHPILVVIIGIWALESIWFLPKLFRALKGDN